MNFKRCASMHMNHPSSTKKALHRELRMEQQVLLYNSRLKLFPRKLKSRWSGPLQSKTLSLMEI